MTFIVILTWNGLDYIKKLLASLDQSFLNKDNCRIVVVDSGSTDGTAEYLESLPKEKIHLIKLTVNLGFTGGNNVGMSYALANQAKYLVLLNQDTLVEPETINKLIKVAETKTEIGIVQPLICYYQNKNEINSWGNELHYLGYGWTGGNHVQLAEIKEWDLKRREITYASAAAVLYKAEMLRKIGLFDENYFAYHEDTDICLRARLIGYQTILEPESIVYHDYYFPTRKNKERYFWLEKNRLYLILKFYQLKTLLLIAPMLCLMACGQLFYAFKNGYLREFFRVRLWLFFHWRKIKDARAKVQSTRLISDREFLEKVAAEIEFQDVNNILLKKVINPIMKFYWSIIKRLI